MKPSEQNVVPVSHSVYSLSGYGVAQPLSTYFEVC